MARAYVVRALSGDIDALNAWLKIVKRYDDLCGLTKVAPPSLILPSPDQWTDLINAVAGPQPFVEGDVVAVQSSVVLPALAELAE